MIVFAKEPVTAALLAEAIPLLRSHWKEVAHYEDIPLDVDTERYLAMEQAGVIRCFTVRDVAPPERAAVYGLQPASFLIGYALYFVNYNMHYQTSLQAVQDVLYMDPSYRGKTSYRFIRWCDEQLQSEGVQAVYHHSKAAHDFGKLLQAQGYELVDLIYAKRLDDKMTIDVETIAQENRPALSSDELKAAMVRVIRKAIDAPVMGQDFEEQKSVDENWVRMMSE